MAYVDPQTHPDPPANLRACDNAVFIEQVRLLYRPRGVIAISLVIAGLGAWAVLGLFPVWMTGVWFGLCVAVVLARLLLWRFYRQAASRDATARMWSSRFVGGAICAGVLWGAFVGSILLTPAPVYHVFAIFVLGGLVAASVVGNAIYLPAFYGFMLPAALPAIAILITRPNQLPVEMGAMLALFIVVISIVGRNLNRAAVAEIRLRIVQDSLLERLIKSEALMAEAQAITHVGHWEFREATNSFVVSKEAMDIYGVDPATFKMSREAVFDRIHPDDRALVDQNYREAVANRASFGTDHRIVMDNGAIKFVHTAGRVFYDAEEKSIYSMGTLQDITQRKETEAKLLFANILLSAEMEAAPDGVLVVDADDNVISYNQRFAAMWNVAPPTLKAAKDAPILAKVTSMMKDPQQFLALVQHLYAHPLEGGEDELKTVDGKFIQRFTTGLRAETGQSLGRVWFFRDVTARRLAEQSVLRLARFDVLTGLANRAIAVEAIQQANAQSVRSATTFAVIYLDLDHFKDVNDTLGHPIGDALLCSVAQRLRANTRLTDTVARFGGDEFAIIAADIREPADAGALAGNLLQAIGEPFFIEGNAIHIGASIGIEMRGTAASDPETLLCHADIALYRAKTEGRGKYRFFTPAMDDEVRTRVTLVTELRKALASEQLFLMFQPEVDIETGRIVGVEALVRWRHPDRGVLGPASFISLAERAGIIRKLGHWILWTACRQAKAWLDAGLAPIRMGVNLSVLEFKSPIALETDILAALAATGLPPCQLELELTESTLMDASRDHNDILQRLRRRGITIAIDDFGTGYSSLVYLSQFPSDRLKIAQEFIESLSETSKSAAIVKLTLGLGRDLGIKVIAEGVETREQLDLLKSWGCVEAQGFYFARPLAAEDLAPLLAGAGCIKVADEAPGAPRPVREAAP